jgi:PAS domain S-box-containing protein
VTLSVDQMTRSRKREYASQTAGLAAVMIAAVVLVGWWAELPLLLNWGAGFQATNPVTALCLAALGLALLHPGKNSRFAFTVGLAVVATGVFVLSQDLFGTDFDFSPWWLAPRPALPGPWSYVTNATALALALAGGSFALSGFKRYRFAATVLGGVTGAIGVFDLLGYLIGIDALYGTASITSPALPTASALLCVAVGITSKIGVMPALPKPRPLWHLLILSGCAVVAPLQLLGIYAGIRIADAQFDRVRGELISEARILSADVDREITGEIETLLALSASPSLRQGDFAEFQRQAEAALAWRHAGHIALINRDKQQIVNTAVPFGTQIPKTPVPESVERAFATSKPQITALFTEPVTGQLIFGVIVPVQIDGENRYALVRLPSPDSLARVIAANELLPGWQGGISDAAHRIIARSDHQDVLTGQELPPTQRHRSGPGGVFEFTDSAGQPSLEAYTRSELTGWATAVWAPKAVLEAPVRALWRTFAAVTFLAFTLVVALAVSVGRIIAHSVGHAARTAIAWGEGSPVPLNGTPVAEVNTLMGELREATATRVAVEQRLRLAMNAARLGSWQYDPIHRIVSWDMRFGEIFDVAENEAVLEEIMKRVHPEDADRVSAALAAALDPADPKVLAIEYRVQHRDGEVRWIETLGLTYFKGAGRERQAVRVVGTVADVTVRKRREEKEHLLMREMNHRAKNVLSVVDAIAHYTTANNLEDFARRFSERIQALSANQNLLVRNEWKGVEIEDLVRAQLGHFADLIGSRILVHGPKLRLNEASAQAIGLALHELATNATKYGALSTDPGRVDVEWATDNGTFTMSWTERNGPLVSAPERRGFGSTVIDSMAKQAVDGEVQLDYAPSGLGWRLTCSAANALERRDAGSGGRTKAA